MKSSSSTGSTAASADPPNVDDTGVRERGGQCQDESAALAAMKKRAPEQLEIERPAPASRATSAENLWNPVQAGHEDGDVVVVALGMLVPHQCLTAVLQ